MKEKIYQLVPNFIQNLLISLFNWLAYRKRYGGDYKRYRNLFENNRTLTLSELRKQQSIRFDDFIAQAVSKSIFYKNIYHNIKGELTMLNISLLPIVDKEMLRKNISEVYTLNKANGLVSKTGGTTGKSLEVLFTAENMQERFAMLDDFRSRFGYSLGRKTAWFSGKNLLTSNDVNKKRFWKTDYFHNVRYYSTFHIKDEYLQHYVKDLLKFRPEFIVGFPSTILEIAKYGLKHNFEFPENTIRAVFPTAESMTLEMRKPIELFFKTRLYDQYASSEGAPFIFECVKGNLHLELQSGIFEVLDDADNPVKSGRLVMTSFTTEGTPLIRYDIGDSVTLDDEKHICSCGNHNPLVKEILGRIDDYIYSPENGKINLGNVSNTLKDTYGITKIQAVQDDLNKIVVFVIKEDEIYSTKMESQFIKNWRERIGENMDLEIKYVSSIPSEVSGKFRIVKNNIKHLLK